MRPGLSRAAMLAAALLLMLPFALAAQTQGEISANFLATPSATDGRPVMISIIKDGAVVRQDETVLRNNRGMGRLDPGMYDVRVEGDGLVTEVKRGVQVFAGRELTLQFAMRAGQGVHTVEYATGGLSREEVAARLFRLDTAVASLKAARHD